MTVYLQSPHSSSVQNTGSSTSTSNVSGVSSTGSKTVIRLATSAQQVAPSSKFTYTAQSASSGSIQSQPHSPSMTKVVVVCMSNATSTNPVTTTSTVSKYLLFKISF